MRLIVMIWAMVWQLHAGDVKQVVFDVTTGDMKRFEQIVFETTKNLAAHYAEQGDAYRAVFVIHGDAYRFFFKDLTGTPYARDTQLYMKQPEYAERLAGLVATYQVAFEVCSFGMKSRRLPFEQLYPFVTPIFSATAGLIEWQEKGYAYVPVR